MGIKGKGNFMKNYLSKHYKHYYILTEDGQSFETSRKECFAQGECLADQKYYKQRWFYDGEQFSYIIRLQRNEQGEALYKLNATSVKTAERYRAKQSSCVVKDAGRCNNDCRNCQRTRYPRIVELDKPMKNNGDNDEPIYFEIVVKDEYLVEENEKQLFQSNLLHHAIAQLEKEQQILIELFYFKNKTQKEIATILGKDQSRISRQLKLTLTKLKKLLTK